MNPFEGAKWITAAAELPSMPIFRRSLDLPMTPTRAIAQICGLGQFELRVNDRKAGDDALEPAWSDYRKTCYYVTRDVTPLLRDGQNKLDVWLGNGMYDVGAGKRYKKFEGSFGPLKLILKLQIDFADGPSQTIVTDETWKVAPGPITFSCIYGGEDYDARRKNPADWHSVRIVDEPGGELVPQTSPPVRVIQTFRVPKVSDPVPGKRVYDLGQNFSGWPVIAARGLANQSITLSTGELLDGNGLVTQKNSGAPVNFTYTLRGDEKTETWHPRFTHTGFRYVQAEGDLDALKDVTGEFIHSSAKIVGHFECSNDLLNRIHVLIVNAIKSNLQHVVTDCPHREKLGWLEQTHLMGPAILYNFDAAELYAKVSRDIRDAQHENGCVPTIAPQYTNFPKPRDVFNDSPEWGSACVINPWLIYTVTGDQAILRENYDSMRRYVEYLHTSREQDGLIDYGLGDWYDIGPGDPGFSKLTSKALTATAIYYRDLSILRDAAVLLGRAGDVDRYTALAAKVKSTFNARLFDSRTKKYDRDSQTASAMPLVVGLVEDEHRAAVLENLVAAIRSAGDHITAGDVGFHFVVRALGDAGRSDVLFDVLTRTDPPSYGAQLARGATTLTEAWDANPKVSQNHLMLGHAEIWFYEYLAGVRVDLSKRGADRIVVRPSPVGDIRWCEARYESAAGPIALRWERDRARFKIDMTLPDGTNARVYLPGGTTAGREIGPGRHRLDCEMPG
jgi:hypothetical protein